MYADRAIITNFNRDTYVHLLIILLVPLILEKKRVIYETKNSAIPIRF